MKSGHPVNAKHAELERRSAHQLRLKAVKMLRSSTQLVKSHGDDLGLEYLWNGDEYGSLENCLKPEILAPVHVISPNYTMRFIGYDSIQTR